MRTIGYPLLGAITLLALLITAGILIDERYIGESLMGELERGGVTVRSTLTTIVRNYIAKPEADLVIGIMIGLGADFDKEYLESYRRSGISHIVSASGFNVTLVGIWGMRIFTWVVGRRWAVFFAVLCTILYGFVSGLNPPVVRAIFMNAITVFGIYFGRQVYAFYSLVLYILGTLLISLDSFGDISWQLSVAATAGILAIVPILDKLKTGRLWTDLWTTLGATAMTIPIVGYHFGVLNVLGVISNILVLWTVPSIMILGTIGALMSLVWYEMGGVLIFIVGGLAYYVNWISRLVSSLDIAVIEGVRIEIGWVAAYYLLLFVWVLKYRNENRN